MKMIKLTRGEYALVDDEDYDFLMQWKWHCSSNGYAVRNQIIVDSKRGIVYMHRQLNKTPDRKETDHINGIKLDNQKSNLRNASSSQNNYNRRANKNNASGYKGVRFHKRHKKWYARIQIGLRNYYLGHFDTALDAAETYDVAAYHLHGEFAYFNFPGGENL